MNFFLRSWVRVECGTESHHWRTMIKITTAKSFPSVICYYKSRRGYCVTRSNKLSWSHMFQQLHVKKSNKARKSGNCRNWIASANNFNLVKNTQKNSLLQFFSFSFVSALPWFWPDSENFFTFCKEKIEETNTSDIIQTFLQTASVRNFEKQSKWNISAANQTDHRRVFHRIES